MFIIFYWVVHLGLTWFIYWIFDLLNHFSYSTVFCFYCRRNCKGNPFCLNNLGEKKWLSQLDETKLQQFNPEESRRQEVSNHLTDKVRRGGSGWFTPSIIDLHSSVNFIYPFLFVFYLNIYMTWYDNISHLNQNWHITMD